MFREDLHACLRRRTDALFELTDAILRLEPLTPAPVTSARSCVAGGCTRLQIPHSWVAFSAPGCCALHRIAFPVVSGGSVLRSAIAVSVTQPGAIPNSSELRQETVRKSIGGSSTVRSMANKRYSTDLSDVEWSLLKPHLPAPKRRGSPRVHSPPEIPNAVFYVLKTGCQWRMLPREFPP